MYIYTDRLINFLNLAQLNSYIKLKCSNPITISPIRLDFPLLCRSCSKESSSESPVLAPAAWRGNDPWLAYPGVVEDPLKSCPAVGERVSTL